jgi:hypothetical protein
LSFVDVAGDVALQHTSSLLLPSCSPHPLPWAGSVGHALMPTAGGSIAPCAANLPRSVVRCFCLLLHLHPSFKPLSPCVRWHRTGPPTSRLKGANVPKLSKRGRGGRKASANDASPSESASDACSHDRAKEGTWLLSKIEVVTKSWSTTASLTSDARAQEQQHVLASICSKSMPSTPPPALSCEERYNNRSAKKEQASKIASTSAKDGRAAITSASRLSLQSSSDDDDFPLGVCKIVHVAKKGVDDVSLATPLGSSPATMPPGCAMRYMCLFKEEPWSADCLLCINCDRLAHKGCVEPVLVQAPLDGRLCLCISNLD